MTWNKDKYPIEDVQDNEQKDLRETLTLSKADKPRVVLRVSLEPRGPIKYPHNIDDCRLMP